MRNCLILGSGRSGTSMVAGCLSKAGYFMGESLHRPTEANPKGFFEAPEINRINEELLAGVTPRRPRLLGRWFFRDRPKNMQRWLARVPVGVTMCASQPIEDRIRRVVQRTPYAFKDPRFSYTLPVWRPFVADARFICVFRDPGKTCRSILKEVETARYLRSFSITKDQTFEMWHLMYSHIVDVHRHEGSWLFIHYDELLNPRGPKKLEEFLDAVIDASFPEARLNRSLPETGVPKKCLDLYDRLCHLAETPISGGTANGSSDCRNA